MKSFWVFDEGVATYLFFDPGLTAWLFADWIATLLEIGQMRFFKQIEAYIEDDRTSR